MFGVTNPSSSFSLSPVSLFFSCWSSTLIVTGKNKKNATPKSTEKFQAFPSNGWYRDAMKLCQGQVWKKDREYIRIVRLERLEVEYKSMPNLGNKEGTKHVTSKKDFCRLLKGAHLLARAKASNPPAV